MSQHTVYECDVCRETLLDTKMKPQFQSKSGFVSFEMARKSDGKRFLAKLPHECHRHVCIDCLNGLIELKSEFDRAK